MDRTGMLPPTRALPEQLLNRTPHGYLVVNRERRVTYLNPAATALLSRHHEDLTGRALHVVLPELDAALPPLPWPPDPTIVEHRGYHASTARWWHAQAYRLNDGFGVLLRDVTEHKQREDHASALIILSEQLGQCIAAPDIAGIILHHARTVEGAYAGAVYTTSDARTYTRLAVAGFDAHSSVHDHPVIHMDDDAQVAAVGRAGAALFLTRAELIAHYPQFTYSDRTRAAALLPLVSGGQQLGVLVFAYAQPQVFDTVQRAYLHTLAAHCAHALARAAQYAAVLEREDRARTTLDALHDGVLLVDDACRLLSANRAAAQLLNLTDRDAGTPVDLTRLTFHAPDGAPLPANHAPVWRALNAGLVVTNELYRVTSSNADGAHRWVNINARPLYRPGSTQPYGAVVSFADVTRQRTYEQQLQHQATRDDLTQLLNRHAFREALAGQLQRAGERCAVLLLSLDRFEMINDAFGASVADIVLCEVAARLNAYAGPRTHIARLGGATFAVLLGQLLSTTDATTLAHALRAAVAPPIHVQGRDLHVTASVGLSFARNDTRDVSRLIHHAQLALRATHAEREPVVLFDDARAAQQQRRADLAHRLRLAIRTQQLHLVYQPIVEVPSGQPVGAEALMRWTDTELGAVGPAEFIPIAEQHGLIHTLGVWALEEACRTAAHWDGPYVSVNVSAMQFNLPSFVTEVQRALTVSGLPSERLMLEVTETAVMSDVDGAIRQMQRLRALGVRLALDDFGTGHSSLASLRQLPLDVLKLDRSFLMGAAHDPRQHAMLEAAVTLASAFDLQVVVEGVETEAQRTLLEHLACGLAQGFLFARPQRPAQVRPLMRRT